MNAKTRENIINLIIQHGEGLLDDSGVDEKAAVALADEIIEVVAARHPTPVSLTSTPRVMTSSPLNARTA